VVRLAGEVTAGGLWDAADCALLLLDYQDNVLAAVFEQDRRVIELNASVIAKIAVRFGIPVILSTVGVDMGANDPVIGSLSAVLPDAHVIDRSQMNAWEDPAFVEAVKATGRRKLVMGGIVTSVCLPRARALGPVPRTVGSAEESSRAV
jgi:nicotinamidase-related amidase